MRRTLLALAVLCAACSPTDRAARVVAQIPPELGRYQIVQLRADWIVRLDTTTGVMEVFTSARPQDVERTRTMDLGMLRVGKP
jgi:hypothetical protein